MLNYELYKLIGLLLEFAACDAANDADASLAIKVAGLVKKELDKQKTEPDPRD